MDGGGGSSGNGASMACMSSAFGAFLAGHVACMYQTKINCNVCTHQGLSVAHLTRHHELRLHLAVLAVRNQPTSAFDTPATGSMAGAINAVVSPTMISQVQISRGIDQLGQCLACEGCQGR